jgi:response regulator of citrate/malate metabolism
MSIRCIIVDDEPLSQKVVQRYVKDIPYLDLVAICSHAFEAMEILGSVRLKYEFVYRYQKILKC